jgi:hypothetical protein
MENELTPPPPNLYDKIKESTVIVPYYQTILIILLTIFLIFALLGINIFYLVGKLFQSAFDTIKPITFDLTSDLGYTMGSVIDHTSDVITDTGKTSLDIVNGTFHDIGDILIRSSGRNASTSIHSKIEDTVKNPSITPPKEPEPTNSMNPIQTPSTASQWCLVGEYQDRRGCIEVGNGDKCLSGQLFPSQHQCLRPS